MTSTTKAEIFRTFTSGETPVRNASTVYIIDDDYFTRVLMTNYLQDSGWRVEAFSSCESYLDAHGENPTGCILLDMHFPGMSGLALLQHIEGRVSAPPVIMISGSGRISEVVRCMRGGAVDVLEKPIVREALVDSVREALLRSERSDQIRVRRDTVRRQLDDLTGRQRQIMDRLLEGQPNKNIAADLGISQRTVETHRALIMARTGAASLPALARLVMCNTCPLVK